MNEFEEKLNAVLNDPAEMERITRLASELMGSDEAKGDGQSGDGELLGRIAKMMGSSGTGNDKTALVQALAPYLRPARQARLQKALRMAKMARLARTVLENDGG